MRVAADSLAHGFGSGPLLFHDLDFRLEPGSLTALTGPSGSGKSTLLGIVAGWIAPRAGRVERSGSGRSCWVFQSPHGVASRTALDHVVLPLLARDLPRRTATVRATQLLQLFGLEEHASQQFATLSGGQAQRLMLARAVAADPVLLLVDEPTAQLDSASAGEVIDSLSGLAGGERVVLIATHDPRVVARCPAELNLAGRC
jgi:putative ABC transport system ATP-binding protein/lipoprotein-releasing system ATP-binding protein